MLKLPNVKEFIGLTLEEAEKKHSKIHVSRNNTQTFNRTMDIRLDRLNVEIDDGKITSARFG